MSEPTMIGSHLMHIDIHEWIHTDRSDLMYLHLGAKLVHFYNNNVY